MFAVKGAIGIFTAKANPRPGAFLSVSILPRSGFDGLIALSGLNADHSAASSVPFEDIDRIIAKHLRKRDSKVIVFCPNQKKLQEFMLLRREWFGRVNKEVHAYKTTSADPYGSRDFQEFKEDSSSALKVLYCINQLNEAVHVKGIDAIVMVRPTKSPVIFQQQLGRALTSGGNRTPLVFDLCNNFGSLGGIAGMQERMERAYEKKSEQGEKPIYEPKDFHVIDEIKDPRELAEELREALNPSTTIDEKISFLEEIAAQNGGQL